jgi:hypothetical protein
MTPAASFPSTSGPLAYRDSVIDTPTPTTLFDYADEGKIFDGLITTHNEEQQRVERRRILRKNRINVAEQRNRPDKPLLSDETVIPDRTIDFNIRVQKAPYIRYIEQATVVLDFVDSIQPSLNLSALAVYHTNLVRVGDWKIPKLLTVDAILLHGAGYKEVVFNPDMPSHSVEEYIRREDLIFPEKTRNIQACSRVYRRYEVTKSQLDDLATKYGFDAAQVSVIKDKTKDKSEAIHIYKCYIRDKDGRVFVAWRGETTIGCSDWLKAPAPFQLGLFDIQKQPPVPMPGLPTLGQPTVPPPPAITPRPIKFFPIVVFPYQVEEDEVILETQGRASLDLHVQDALTSLWSATVNGTVRASRFYPTRKPAPGATPKNEELFVLRHGAVSEGEYNIFQPTYPNNIAIAVSQTLQSKKSQEIGATDYAAMNRQDTRKTATELNAAQEASAELTAPNISLYSLNELKIETLRFEIIKSAIQVEMALNTPIEQRKFVVPAEIPVGVWSSTTLVIAMAADAQVVRRAQRQSRFLQYYPFVANTPYAQVFLETMLNDIFPEEFQAWKQQIGEADQQKQQLTQMLQQSLGYLQKMPGEAMPPEEHQNYANFLNAVDGTINPKPAK